MNTDTITPVFTPTSPYWGMLKGLSNKEKLDLIVLLSTSIATVGTVEENPSRRTSSFDDTCQDESDRKLDAALACFHKSWGGNKSPIEIARDLRQGTDMTRDVEVW